MNHVADNINRLSRELLIRVFSWLPFHQRHEIVPLVCRKWAQLTSVPCPLWEHPCIDLQVYVEERASLSGAASADTRRTIRWANVLQWFSVRSLWVHSVEIRNFSQDFATQHDCPPGGLASLFGVLWDCLENLYISNCAPVMRSGDLVHLSCFTRLVRLDIDSLQGPVEASQINHIGRLTKLQELRIFFAGESMEQNMLGGFPMELTALRQLRELQLATMGPKAFYTLPDSITNWQELSNLQLHRCGLQKLPECISSLSKLETLLMTGFSTPGLASLVLPDSMSTLTLLSRLILSSWDHSSLSRSVGSLSQLQELDLSFSPLTFLPAHLQCCAQLRALHFSCCEIQKLPEAVKTCNRLLQLDLAANFDLNALPAGPYLTNLRHLNVSRCNFHRVPAALALATNLEKLDMSYNSHIELNAEGRYLLLNLPSLKMVNMVQECLDGINFQGRRSAFKPTRWNDCSMYNFFLLSKELVQRRPNNPMHIELFDKQELLASE